MKLSAPVHRLRRDARRLARSTGSPLHEALDTVARREGFASWSAMLRRVERPRPPEEVLDAASNGLVLLGARPGQGKTRLGLQVLVEGMRRGRACALFTLEYTDEQARQRLREVGADTMPVIETSEAIEAASVLSFLEEAGPGAVVLIDYLQLLDQQRTKPPLHQQLQALEHGARAHGALVVCLSQIDRGFDEERGTPPDLDDVRTPNPIDVSVFSAACFVHRGQLRLHVP